MIRALFTLGGVAAAGLLIWIASTLELGSTGEFWGVMGLLAAAGLVLGLSQLFGGWTKWGWPMLSPVVFLLGFLPTLVVGGWIVLSAQPDGGWQQGRLAGWSDDLGILGFVQDFQPFLPVIALVAGLVLAFSFDTTGPRTHVVATEPVVGDYDRSTVARNRTVAEELRSREDDVKSPAAAPSSEERVVEKRERVEVRDRDRDGA